VRGQERGRLDQAVDAMASGEAHVVAHRHVIDARLGDGGCELRQPVAPVAKVVLSDNESDLERAVLMNRRHPIAGIRHPN
jgi:hypothetical protein